MATETLTSSLRETLALFEGSAAPRTTTEVAAELDLGRRSTYDRLDRLVEHGCLETKKVGANARVWWRPAAVQPDADTAPATEFLEEVEASIVVVDETYEIVRVNDTTERYFGLDREQLLGRDRRDVLDECAYAIDDSAAFAERVPDAGESTVGPEQVECHVRGGEGREERWLERRSRPIEYGQYAGGRVELYYDITHRKRAEQTLREFEQLVDAVEEYAIFTLDTAGCVRTWNAGAVHIKGYEADEILGEHVSTFYTEADREDGVPGDNLARAARRGAIEDEGWRVRADGSRFWANVTITAIRDDEGDLQGFAKVTRDTTERHRTEQELRETNAFIESVLNTDLDIIYTFDRDGNVRYWNDQVSEVTGYTDEEIEEMSPPDFIAEEAAEETLDAFSRVFEHGEAITTELPLETKGGERVPYEFSASPLRDEDGEIIGFTGIGRNISERKAKERALERQREDVASELDDVFARIDDGFYAVDEQLRFTYVNDRAEELLQHSEAELLGRRVWEVFPDARETPASEAFHTALETQEPTEYELYFDTLEFWVAANVYPSESGLSVYFRDVTEQKEREQQLARFRRAVETAGHAIYMTDTDGTITYVNPAFEEMTGYTREEAIGETPALLDSGKHTEAYFDRLWGTVTAGNRWEEEVINQRKSGELYTAYQILSPLVDDDGDVDRFVAIQTDVTEQKVHERTLERQIRQQEVVTELGRRALEEDVLDTLFAEASRLVAETLDNEYCKVLDLDSEEEELLLRKGVGWDDGIVGEATVSADEDDSLAAYTLAVDEPIVVEDLITEERFSGPELLTSHNVKSGISVVIGSHDQPWGILGTHDTAEKTFTEQDVNFVQSVANILASAIDRHRTEETLRRQHEELAALNNISEAVRETTGAVIEQSTREEITSTVCEQLVATGSYRLAWVGEADPDTQTVAVRTAAGDGIQGYIDAITISLDSDDPRSKGPTARALESGETAVVRDILTDPDYEPWRVTAREYGFRSSAAIPIRHENTVYGVLNVYSDRPYAFDTKERAVISQLGEVVGHAIAATERKRALMSDELVEVEFSVPDIFDALDAGVSGEGTITFETVVPITEGEYLVYGTTTADAGDGLAALVDAAPSDARLRFRDGDSGPFELRIADPSVLSTVASLGGAIEEAVIEGCEYHLTLHLSPSTDVSRILEAIQETYADAEMVARRQIARPDDTSQRVYDVLDETLTDRQRATLRAAYHAGFFEWPREANAETVAASLDIAPATFSQHLRKGEKKVFDALFSGTTGRIDAGN